MPISPLPPAPSAADPTNFASKADALLAALPTFITQANALEVNVEASESASAASAAAALSSSNDSAASATDAEASALAAASGSSAPAWISGTTYSVGQVVFSPINHQSYRRITNGTGTTDPSTDTTNWTILSMGGDGDKGDVAVSGNGLVWTIESGAVNKSKLLANLLPSEGFFYKLDFKSPAFTKTGAGTLSIKAGTKVEIAGASAPVVFSSDTAITMPSLVAGTDYAIWVKDDASIQAATDFVSAPAAGNWRMIGGFHYGLVAPGTTVAGGSFATTGNGMIWTQTDVDNIAGINKFSLWDVKFRPACTNPRGMVLVGESTWVDIYLCNTDTDANGTSRAGSNIASSTVLPKKPVAFGGNGTATYATPTWWDFNEIARSKGKRMLWESEFVEAAFGVTENQSIDATASTYPTTQRNAGYTSKYGIEQATGHHWTWGNDSGGAAGTAYIGNGGRGTSYNNSTVRAIFGGTRASGANSGSRASSWDFSPAYVFWSIGLRAASDHLISA